MILFLGFQQGLLNDLYNNNDYNLLSFLILLFRLYRRDIW